MATPPSAPIIRNAPDALPNTLEFCWFPPASLGSPATITGYRITLQPGNLVYTAAGNQDEIVITGLTNGQTYRTTIEATNDNGVTYGPPASFRECQPGSPPPAPPTSVSSFALTTPGSAVVSWTPPAILPDSQIFWYVVTTASSDPTDTIVSTNGWAFMQSNLIITGLNSNSTYSFNVRPVNCPGYGPILSTNRIGWNIVLPFLPSQLTGLNFWVDASNTATLTLSGSGVVRWSDATANGRYVSTTSVSATPQYTTYNSLPAVRFDGTDDYFPGNFPLSDVMTATQKTFFVVGQATAVDTNNGNPYENDSFIGDVNGWVGLYLKSTGVVGSYNWTGNATSVETPYTIGTMGVFGYQQNNTVLGVNLNGNTPATTTTSGTGNLTNAFWLARTYNANTYLNGHIMETLVYGTVLTPFNRQKVEGYLAWKWGLQSNLPTTHPFYTARPIATSVFSPASFSGLQGWFDGADPLATGTAPANGASISSWVDKSTASNSGIAFGTAPIYSATEQAVNFSAQNGYYTTPISASSTNETVFCVFKSINTSGTLVLGPSDAGGRDLGIWWSPAWLQAGANNVATYTNTSSNSVAVNTRFMGELVNSGGTMTAYVNAGNTNFSSSGALTAGRTTYIGGVRIGGVSYYNATQYINEVIFYNRALSTQDRQTVEGYLAWKWGLQGSLPSNHPYKNAAP